MRSRRLFAESMLLLCVLTTTIGCGTASTADVSGTVTYQGKPVRSGSVIVFDATGTPHSGDIKSDGAYIVQGVPVGQVQFSIQSPEPPRPLPPEVSRGKTEKLKIPKPAPPSSLPDRRNWFAIPAHYSTPASSGLDTKLNPGPNTFDFDLK